jgi:hypothetical protein
MSQLFTNNAATTLASGLAAGNTSLTVTSGKGTLFPSPGGNGEYALLTLVRASDGAVEVVKLTTRSTDTFTVVRAQESTTALDFLTGDKVELRITAGFLNRLEAGRNKIINGGMQVAQRGTTFTNCINTYTLDRWRTWGGPGLVDTSQIGAASTSTSTGYAMRQQRTAGDTNTSNITLGQALETKDSYSLAGKTVTLSFRCVAGATFLSSGATFTAEIVSGTATDATPSAISTSVASLAVPISGSWTRYTVTGTVAANATQLAVSFSRSAVGTAGATDYFDICEVQLEESPVATPFEQRAFGAELAACQRFYYRSTPTTASGMFGPAYTDGTTTARVLVAFPVTMRAAPTAMGQSGTATDYGLRIGGSAPTVCSAVPTYSIASTAGCETAFTVASGLTVGQAGVGRLNGATSGFLGWDVEL